MLLAMLLATPAHSAAALPTAAELRTLFMVGNAALPDSFGTLLRRSRLSAAPSIVCTLRQTEPHALTMTGQEGGPVVSLQHLDAPPAPRAARAMSAAAFSAQVRQAGAALARAGIDSNLAPVAEITSDPPPRSDARIPQQAAAIATRFAQAMKAANITPVLKHYPGKLTHCAPVTSLPGFQLRKGSKEVEVCPGSAAEVWSSAEVFPLVAADIVMLSNRIYPDVSALPAILDPVYVRHLRAADFQDLVISDALSEISNQPATAVQALKSADVVLLASPEQGYAAIPTVLSALRSGELNADDIQAKRH